MWGGRSISVLVIGFAIGILMEVAIAQSPVIDLTRMRDSVAAASPKDGPFDRLSVGTVLQILTAAVTALFAAGQYIWLCVQRVRAEHHAEIRRYRRQLSKLRGHLFETSNEAASLKALVYSQRGHVQHLQQSQMVSTTVTLGVNRHGIIASVEGDLYWLAGYRPSDVIGKPASCLIADPTFAAEHDKRFAAAVAEGKFRKPHMGVSGLMRHADGSSSEVFVRVRMHGSGDDLIVYGKITAA